MHIHVLTLFPEMFVALSGSSIVKRAIEANLVSLNTVNFREFAHDRHKTVDDSPYGGGPGMVLKPEPVFEAVDCIRQGLSEEQAANLPVILLTPQGRLFSQQIALELTKHNRLILICGRYEGVDERIREHLVTDEISIGDYVLTGGELPALILIDAIARLLPDVLGDPTGAQDDSHAMGLLEYPHYTRPPEFREWKVPDILLSGDHAKIDQWRREQSMLRTYNKRPDMLEKIELTKEDKKFVESLKVKSRMTFDL